MKPNEIRQDIIKMLTRKGTGHTAGSLGMADVFTALYSTIKHNPRKPNWEERDRIFVTNKLAPAWHATLAHSGYFAKKDLLTKEMPPGEGQGPSIALGSALASRMNKKTHHTYCIINDSEHNGQVWEALMLAGKHKLSNLTLIIDRNGIQADGHTEEITQLEPLRAKYEAFNWHAIEVDGHNIEHIIEALKEAKTITTKPTVIIAHTIPGKGVSFIENNYEWYDRTPTQQEEEQALEELHEKN